MLIYIHLFRTEGDGECYGTLGPFESVTIDEGEITVLRPHEDYEVIGHCTGSTFTFDPVPTFNQAPGTWTRMSCVLGRV